MNPFISIKLLQWSELGSHIRKLAIVRIKWLEMAATLCKSGLVSIKYARVSAAKIRVWGGFSGLTSLTKVGRARYTTLASSSSSTSHLKTLIKIWWQIREIAISFESISRNFLKYLHTYSNNKPHGLLQVAFRSFCYDPSAKLRTRPMFDHLLVLNLPQVRPQLNFHKPKMPNIAVLEI